MSENETPLVSLERDIAAYKTEVDETLKSYAKITLRSSNNDKSAYRKALEDGVAQLEEYKLEGSNMIIELNELKRDDEPLMVKQKEFNKRQTTEVKKLKDILSKIDKQNRKLSQDLDKQVKLDEKEKNASSVSKMFGKADEIEVIEDSKINENDESGESNDSKTESKSDSKGIEDINTENSEPKGLKELMLEEDRKADERKEKDLAKPVVLSKKERERLKKEEKKQKEEEKKQKRLEEKRLKEEKKKKPNEVAADLKGMMAMAFGPDQNEFSNSDVEDAKSNEEEDTEEASTTNLKNMYKDIKKIEEANEQVSNNVENATSNLGNIYKDIKRIEGKTDPIKSQELVGIAREVRDIDEKRVSDNKSSHNSRSRDKKVSQNDVVDDEVDEDGSDYDDDVYEEEDEDLKEVTDTKTVDIPTAGNEDEFSEGKKLVITKNIIPEYEGDLEAKKNDIVEFLDYSEEDVEWLEVKDKDGEIGFVPRSHVELYNEQLEPKEPKEPKKKSKSKWKSFRGSLAADLTGKRSLLESTALKNSGAVPSSFSDAILPSLVEEYNYSDYLKVKLTESNLNFKNFYWESKENKLRNKLVQFQKLFLIHKCTNIPTPNKDDVTVLSRTLRICLFDGVSILSNIHTIRAHIIGRDERTWNFEDDLSDNVSISDYSEFFIRSNLMNDNLNLSVLFELSIYCRINSTNEESDLCCGWSSLPLIDPATKQHLVNKSYDLILNGGSLFDSKIPLDPKTRRNSGSNFNDLISKMFKESKIKLNIKEPANVFFDTLNCLPEPIIGSTVTAPFIKYYREELGIELLAPMIEIGSFDASTEPIQSTFLSSFSQALRQPDILDAVRFEFTLLKENMKRDERNDNSKCRHNFVKAYEEIAYPLLYHSEMPMFDLRNHEDMEIRTTIIAKIAKLVKKHKLLQFLLDGQEEFAPFSIDEVRYELLS